MLVQRRPERAPWRHLLWSLPLTVLPAGFAWFTAHFARCVDAGCTDAGLGSPAVEPSLVLPLLVASGLLLGAGFMSPWHRSVQVRLTVAAVVFLGWVAWNTLAMTLALLSAAPPAG